MLTESSQMTDTYHHSQAQVIAAQAYERAHAWSWFATLKGLGHVPEKREFIHSVANVAHRLWESGEFKRPVDAMNAAVKNAVSGLYSEGVIGLVGTSATAKHVDANGNTTKHYPKYVAFDPTPNGTKTIDHFEQVTAESGAVYHEKEYNQIEDRETIWQIMDACDITDAEREAIAVYVLEGHDSIAGLARDLGISRQAATLRYNNAIRKMKAVAVR